MKIVLSDKEQSAVRNFFELIPQVKLPSKHPMVKFEHYVDNTFTIDEDYFLAHLQNVKLYLSSVVGLFIAFSGVLENFATSTERVERQFYETENKAA